MSVRCLLARRREGEFAVADAEREALGKVCGRFLAVGRDKFGEGREQARLRQAVAVDAVDARLGPGVVQIAERHSLLLMFRNACRSLDRLRGHAEYSL